MTAARQKSTGRQPSCRRCGRLHDGTAGRLATPARRPPARRRTADCTHLTPRARYGTALPRPQRARATLISDIEAAGLTGRGGAAFPVHRKLRAVLEAADKRRKAPTVIANGAESEPASDKDATLLWLAPHLVLDGLQLAAEAVGARHRDPRTRTPTASTTSAGRLRQALQERAGGARRPRSRPARHRAGPVPLRPGDRPGQPPGRRPRDPDVHAAPDHRARPEQRPHPGPERGDARAPGADRPPRPALVPRGRHRRASRGRCSPPSAGPTASRGSPRSRSGMPLRDLLGDLAAGVRGAASAATTAAGSRRPRRSRSPWTTTRLSRPAPGSAPGS